MHHPTDRIAHTTAFVLLSDKSGFSLQHGNGRVCVYHRKNEHYADCCVLERDRFRGRGSIMVWAATAHPMVVVHH